MKQAIAAVLWIVPTLAHPVQATEFTGIQTDGSSLDFVYTQMGVPVEGRFKKFAAQLNFDPDNLSTAKATIDLDVSSIDAGSTEANNEVAGKDWFNAKTFPHAEFVSTGFKALGGNRYQVSGNLNIKGRTQNVSAPFTLSPGGALAVIDGGFMLNRADFAIGEGSWTDFSTVANEIRIKFHFLVNTRS